MTTENMGNDYRPVYLFQIDSARENRPFFERMHEAIPGSVYFRGLDFKVGLWTPDGVRVDLTLGEVPRCSLTLIELEPTESTALRSSRKYLHESSTEICGAFMQYLQRVMEDCDSRADPRGTSISRLANTIAQRIGITIRTAGALRSGVAFLEDSPLINQTDPAQVSEASRHYIPTSEESGHRQFEMRGRLRLSPEQSKSLRRCISILDAVIRQNDHSGANYHGWRQKSPLKNLLKRTKDSHPTLKLFILDQKNGGITIDSESLLSELVEIWVEEGKQLDNEVARKLIVEYFPTAEKIRSHDEMGIVFEAARTKLENQFGTWA